MAITGIYTSISDTALGNPSVSDGIAMLATPAVAQSGTGGLQFELDTAYLVTSVKDVTNLGVTEDVNPTLIFHVREFFEKSGNGAKLWVVGFVDSAEGIEAFVTETLANVVRGTTITSFDNRPRILGLVGNAAYAEAVTGEEGGGEEGGGEEGGDAVLPEITETLAASLQTTLSDLFNESYRMVAILDGMALDCAASTGIVTEQLATTLKSGVEINAPRVGILLTTSTPGKTAGVGEALGQCASISLATSIGSMLLGQVRSVEYFIDRYDGDYINSPVAAVSRSQFDLLGNKQYIFTRTRPQMPGVYYNDGATCNDPTKALSSLEFIRVGNAVCDSVEAFFVRLINTNMATTATGEIDPAYKSATLADLTDRYLRPRIQREEAQAINVDFWAKDGNFIQSRAIEVQVEIFPNASLREVYIESFFVSSLE